MQLLFVKYQTLSVLMLRNCAPVFIFTTGSSTLLGRPRCGLSIWLSLLAIFNTLFWVYANLFHEKTDKTRKYSKSAILVWYENSRRRLLGAQSINSERVSLTKLSVAYAFRRAFRSRSFIFKLVEMFLSVLDFVPWIMKRIIHLQRFHEELPNIYITFSKL